MHGLKRGRDEETYQPASSKFARREHVTDVTFASRIPQIIPPGTVLPLWGLGDAEGILGNIIVDDNKIDTGGSAYIVGGKMADGCEVALKVFTPMHDYQVTLIRRELDIARKLAPHPNILPFLGTCLHHNAVLVSPYMREGNLLQYLRRNPAVNRHKLIVQVAEALSHVHEVHKLVHGDLKCENVLISDHGDALLADFGLSTAIEKAASDVTTVTDIRQKSTFRFNAPELMLGSVTERDGNGLLRARSKTTATDVYAFGMLVLQAYTEERPWAEYRDDIQMITAVCITKRMHTRPDSKSHAVAVGFTDQHWNLCSSCWNYEPHNRPTIRHVLSALVQSPTRENPQQPAEQSVVHDYHKQLAAARAVTMPVASALGSNTADADSEPGAASPRNAGAPSPQPGQPQQIQQLHGGPPFMPPAPQGAVNPQQLAQQQQQLERFRTMPLPVGPPQTQPHAFGQPQPPFGQPPQQQPSFGPAPPLPGNTPPLNAISHQAMTRFAASQNSRPSQVIPIQDLGEWRAIFEKLLTVCKDVDVLLPYAYNIQPDQHVAKMLIDIKLAAREQQQHYIAPLSPTLQRVLIDTKVLQRFIAFVSDWTIKARALVQAHQQQHGIQQHQMPPQNPPSLGGALTQASPLNRVRGKATSSSTAVNSPPSVPSTPATAPEMIGTSSPVVDRGTPQSVYYTPMQFYHDEPLVNDVPGRQKPKPRPGAGTSSPKTSEFTRYDQDEVETANRSEEDALSFLLNSANDFQSPAMGGPPDSAGSIDPNFDLTSMSALYDLIKNITNADSSSFPNTFKFDLPPVAGPSSPKTSAANNGDWAFDFTRYGQDEASRKANTPDLVHPNQFAAGPETVYYTPAEFYEPLVNDAPGNGGGDGPPPKDPVAV